MSGQRKDYEMVLKTSNVQPNDKKLLEDICKDKMIYVSAKSKNNYQMDKEVKAAIENVPQPPNRTTEEIHTTINENGCGAIEHWKISMEEAITYGLADIADSVTYAGKVAAISSYKIAESILTASRNMVPTLERYIDVVERKNILDEYYMLLNDIEKYESTLIEWGCIADAYDKLNLVQYPTIDVDERGIWMLMNVIKKEDNLSKIIDASKQHFVDPFKLLWICMESVGKWRLKVEYFDEYHQSALECNDFTLPIMVKLNDNKLEFNGIPSALFQVNNIETEMENRRLYKMAHITAFDGFAKKAIECAYNSIGEQKLKVMFMNDKYATVVNAINSINQAIQLTNLRNLHSGLRYQVRRCRLEKSLSDQ